MHEQKHVTVKRKSGKNAAWKNHKKNGEAVGFPEINEE